MTDPAARAIAGKRFFIHEENNLLYGYTTIDFSSHHLKDLFSGKTLLFLRQVHGDRILGEEEWQPGCHGDGLLVGRGGAAAIVQTADCLPLFFWDSQRRRGGILHVGWRGLLQGIEKRLLDRLGKERSEFSFFLGPAIDGSCYEVGEELADLFAKKPYANRIFSKIRPGKYHLDIKSGLKLSLASAGIASERIGDCGLCTYCSPGLFPSFRRDGGTGRRIFNFLLLADDAGA